MTPTKTAGTVTTPAPAEEPAGSLAEQLRADVDAASVELGEIRKALAEVEAEHAKGSDAYREAEKISRRPGASPEAAVKAAGEHEKLRGVSSRRSELRRRALEVGNRLSAARRALSEAHSPEPVDTARDRLNAARAQVAELEAERAAIPGQLEEAATAGDFERIGALKLRQSHLDVHLLAAARDLVTRARLDFARAMVPTFADEVHESRLALDSATAALREADETHRAAAQRHQTATTAQDRWRLEARTLERQLAKADQSSTAPRVG